MSSDDSDVGNLFGTIFRPIPGPVKFQVTYPRENEEGKVLTFVNITVTQVKCMRIA